MKKLLILMLVLGLASTASALPIITSTDPPPANPAYDFEVVIGGYITLTLEGTTADASKDGGGAPYGINEGVVWVDYAAYSGQIGNVGAPTNAMGGAADISLIYMDGTAATGGGPVFTAAPPAGDWDEDTDVDVGAWFTFEVSPLADAIESDTYDLQLLAADWSIAATYVVHVIPEPATIALLGLGSLFLMRRRRK